MTQSNIDYELGNKYYNGIHTNFDNELKEAIKYYKLSADNENSSAQLLLGLMYIDGVGGIFDRKEGMRLLLSSLNQGNVLSKLCYYFKNYHTRENLDFEMDNESELQESMKLLLELFNQGNSSAANLLGFAFEIGKGVDIDFPKHSNIIYYQLHKVIQEGNLEPAWPMKKVEEWN
jgi:TPR repeat protein